MAAVLSTLSGLVALVPGVARADTTTGIWSVQSVGDPQDPPSDADLAAIAEAVATGKKCASQTRTVNFSEVYYVLQTDGVDEVPVVQVSHSVRFTYNCVTVSAVSQQKYAAILSPGYTWRQWDSDSVTYVRTKTGAAVSAAADVQGTYASCPDDITCVDDHQPYSDVVVYPNGKVSESAGDPGASGAIIVPMIDIVPNVG